MEKKQIQPGYPEPFGLYHPQQEHDACGAGFIANLRGEKSHDTIEQALEILVNLTHRGACGCDEKTGDGAGLLIQMPHAFMQQATAQACDGTWQDHYLVLRRAVRNRLGLP